MADSPAIRLAAVWEAELLPLLQDSPHLSAVTLLEELQRRYPGEYGPSALRTLQRRMRQWRATHGGECEVYFAQEHPPGRQGLSDFTDAGELGVTIASMPFVHRSVPVCARAFGLAIELDVVEGGESFPGAVGRAATRAVALRRRSGRASHRQPFGGVQKSERCRTARLDQPVRGAVRALRDAPYSQ